MQKNGVMTTSEKDGLQLVESLEIGHAFGLVEIIPNTTNGILEMKKMHCFLV